MLFVGSEGHGGGASADCQAADAISVDVLSEGPLKNAGSSEKNAEPLFMH